MEKEPMSLDKRTVGLIMTGEYKMVEGVGAPWPEVVAPKRGEQAENESSENDKEKML